MDGNARKRETFYRAGFCAPSVRDCVAGFSLFWEVAALEKQRTAFFFIVWIAVIGIGVYLVFGAFIQRLRLRGRTFYAITNKKIMIKRGNRIAMYDAWDLPSMSIRIHKNGNGTIGVSGNGVWHGQTIQHPIFCTGKF